MYTISTDFYWIDNSGEVAKRHRGNVTENVTSNSGNQLFDIAVTYDNEFVSDGRTGSVIR